MALTFVHHVDKVEPQQQHDPLRLVLRPLGFLHPLRPLTQSVDLILYLGNLFLNVSFRYFR